MYYDIGTLVKARIETNDRIAAANAEAKKLVEAEKRSLEVIDGFILKKLNEMGVDSAKTEFGTAFKDNKESFTIEDREAFFKWVREKDAWHFVPAKINSTDAKTYMKETEGLLPPGVKYNSFIMPKIRKPTKKVK